MAIQEVTGIPSQSAANARRALVLTSKPQERQSSVRQLVVFLLALGSIASAQVNDYRPLSDFPKLVETFGYKVQPLDKTRTRYMILCDGSQVYARLEDTNGKFRSLRLSTGYDVGKYIPYSKLQSWSKYLREDLRAGSSIDGTAFLVLYIFGPEEFNTLGDDLKRLAKWDKEFRKGPLYGLKAKPAPMFKFAHGPNLKGVKLCNLWSRDFEYLQKVWNAKPKDPNLKFWFMPGLQSMETIIGVSFSNGTYWIGSAPDPISPSSKIELAVMGIPHPYTAAQNIDWATTQDLHGYIRISKVIDLSDGITLQQLHRRLDDFGKHVAALHLDLDVMKQGSPKR